MGRHHISNKVVFSLKYKILVLLMVLSTLGLGVFLWISLSYFTADKRNYLLEHTTQVTTAETELLNKEFSYIIDNLNILIEGYDVETLEFSSSAREYFFRQKSILKSQIIRFDGAERVLGFLLNRSKEDLQVHQIPFLKATEIFKPIFICDARDPSRMYLVSRISQSSNTYVVAETRLLSVSNLMERKNILFALVCPDNDSSFIDLSKNLSKWNWKKYEREFLSPNPFTRELRMDGKDHLMSGSKILGTSLHLISIVNVENAMKVIKRLQLQAVLIFLTILGVVAIVALLLARRMTAALEDLTTATERIAVGDFSISLRGKSSDEVSVLTNSFVWMKDKIVELLEKAKQATRMETEIETAQLVQKTLFPPPIHSTNLYHLNGQFRTASECGGDLWHYFETPEFLFLFIGDVVGHGLPSALMTTAARSVTAVVNSEKVYSPAKILGLLNHAIYETSKGGMWMTFFVGRYEKATGTLTYSSASHNPPFQFVNKESLKKRDIQSLMDSVGPSLGKQETAEYTETQIQIGLGDILLFYTDGLTECTNPQGEMLGEMKLVKNLIQTLNRDKNINSFVQTVHETLESFREDHPLEDDLTYFAFQRIG